MTKSQIVYLEHTSKALTGNPLRDPATRRIPLYLPPNYQAKRRQRYPVVWVLAPFTSWGERFFNLQAWDENIVQRMDRLIAAGQVPPTILAFPDCFTRLGGSQYVNSTAVGRYEDYIVEELVPLVDATFRTLADRNHRGVMGYSSGGYGALMLTMRHPELFGAVASHSGDMGFEHCYWPDIPGAVRTLEQWGGLDGFFESLRDTSRVRERGRDWFAALNLIAMSACYSPNPHSPHGFDLLFDPYTGAIQTETWGRWLSADPVRVATQYIDALKSLRALYFDCGTRDEYNLFLGARMLHTILENQGVPHSYEEFDGGHYNLNWRYEHSLPMLTTALAPKKG